MDDQSNGIVARLEVRSGTDADGKEEWSDAGQINVDGGTAETLELSTPAAAAAAAAASVNVSAGRKRMLPRRTKLLLSPNAKIKADRRANFLFRHSPDGVDTNLLILLHGAGDSHKPFHELAKRMQLPQTASLSIHASSCSNGFTTLPFNLGHAWFEEMDYTSTGTVLSDSDPRRVSTLSQATDKLIEILQSLYPVDGGPAGEGWQSERIFLFGFSSGACLVMEICLRIMMEGKRPLGGAVCVAGGVKCERPLDKKGQDTSTDSTSSVDWCTPILIFVGSEDDVFPPSAAQHAYKLYNDVYTSSVAARESEPILQSGFDPVAIYAKKGKGHAMIDSEEETRRVMEFFSQRLVREMPAMEVASY